MIRTSSTTFTRLEVVASGIVDAGDVRAAVEAIETALGGDGRAALLVDIRGVEDVTMKAFGGDLASGRRLLGRLGGLERVAVVGDASWLRSLARLQRRVPGAGQVRLFEADALDEARAWVGAAPAAELAGDAGAPGRRAERVGRDAEGDGARGDAPAGGERGARAERPTGPTRSGDGPARRPGLTLLEGDGPGLYTLELDGRIGREDVEAMVARLDELGGGEPRVRLLGLVRRFDGFEPAVLLSPALWRLQGEGLSRVSRFALVGSVDWLGRLLESAGRLQRVEVRTFAPDDEARARAWLAADEGG